VETVQIYILATEREWWGIGKGDGGRTEW
jgi:hypothetical protein